MRDGTRDGCRGRMKGEKIHSVLISGLRRGYIVLGAFYLDVAAAAEVCLSPSLLFLFSLYLCHPYFSSIRMCVFARACVRLTRINVFIFLSRAPSPPLFFFI